MQNSCLTVVLCKVDLRQAADHSRSAISPLPMAASSHLESVLLDSCEALVTKTPRKLASGWSKPPSNTSHEPRQPRNHLAAHLLADQGARSLMLGRLIRTKAARAIFGRDCDHLLVIADIHRCSSFLSYCQCQALKFPQEDIPIEVQEHSQYWNELLLMVLVLLLQELQ